LGPGAVPLGLGVELLVCGPGTEVLAVGWVLGLGAYAWVLGFGAVVLLFWAPLFSAVLLLLVGALLVGCPALDATVGLIYALGVAPGAEVGATVGAVVFEDANGL